MAKNKIVLDADIRGFASKVKSISSSISKAFDTKYKLNIDTGNLEKITKSGIQDYAKLKKEANSYATQIDKAKKESITLSQKERKEVDLLKERLEQYKKKYIEINELKKRGEYKNINTTKLDTLKKEAEIELKFKTTNMRTNHVARKQQIREEQEKEKENIRERQRILSTGNGISGWLKRKSIKMLENDPDSAGGNLVGNLSSGVSMLGGIGAAASLAGGVYGAARKLTDFRQGLAKSRLHLLSLSEGGRTNQDLDRIQNAGSESGMGVTESLQTAEMMQRNLGRTSDKDVSKVARLGIQTGLAPSEVTDIAGLFRGAATGKEGLNVTSNLQKTEDMIARAMTSSFDMSGMLKFTEESANATKELAKGGILDPETVTNIMQGLAKSEFFKTNPGMSGNAVKGLEGMASNRGGFLMAAHAKVAKDMGVDLSIEEQIRLKDMGLFGGSAKSFGDIYGKNEKDSKKREAIGAKAKAKSVDATLDEIFKGEAGSNPERFKTLLGSEMKNSELGVNVGDTFLKNNHSLQGPGGGGLLDKMDPEKAKALKESIDLKIEKNKADMEKTKAAIGEKLIGMVTTIDQNILKMTNKMLGLDSNQSKSSTQIAEDLKNLKKSKSEESMMGSWVDDQKYKFGMGKTADIEDAEREQRKRNLSGEESFTKETKKSTENYFSTLSNDEMVMPDYYKDKKMKEMKEGLPALESKHSQYLKEKAVNADTPESKKNDEMNGLMITFLKQNLERMKKDQMNGAWRK